MRINMSSMELMLVCLTLLLLLLTTGSAAETNRQTNQGSHDNAEGPASVRQPADPCKGLRARRKEINDMTTAEYNRYVTAISRLRSNGVLNRFVQYHTTYADLAHGGCIFLPWHRAFLFEFERELNKISPGVYIPYWDWTKRLPASSTQVSSVFTRDTIWNRMGGGAGNAPIPNAPFANWRVGGSLVLRDFFQNNGNIGSGGDRYFFATSRMIARQVAGRDAFGAFSNLLEGQHGIPHVAVGGNMGQVPTSPSDPIFWSHHGFVDYIWLRWQQAGNGNKFGGSHAPFSCTRGQRLAPFNKTVGQVFSEIQQCTTYEPSSRAGPTARFAVAEESNMADRQVTGSSSSGGGVLEFGSPARQGFLRGVAQKKTSRPGEYRAEVREGTSVLDSMTRSARAFGMPAGRVAEASTAFQNLLLSLGVDVANDRNVVSQSDSAIAADGRRQAASLAAPSTASSTAPSTASSTAPSTA